MSKKVLALLMAVVMVAACVIFAAPEAKATDPHDNTHCVCGGDAVGATGHECGEANWQAWPAGEVPTAGYYYLTSDVVLEAQAVGTTDTAGIVLTDDLYICLNGYSISSSANKIFTTLVENQKSEKHVNLVICDCDTTGSVTNTSEATGIYGPIAGVQSITQFIDITIFGGDYSSPKTTAVDGGLFFIKAGGATTSPNTVDPKIKIYGGTFHDAKASKGGLVYVQGNSDLYIYGGTFYNGEATDRGGLVNGHGSVSEIFIYNGIFHDGKSVVRGGLVSAAGPLTIHNGTFYNGKCLGDATYSEGGLISCEKDTTINGGVFYNGEAEYGGNIFHTGSSSSITFNGGVVYDGVANKEGGNIHMQSKFANAFDVKVYRGTAPVGSNIYNKAAANPRTIIGMDPATVYGATVYNPILWKRQNGMIVEIAHYFNGSPDVFGVRLTLEDAGSYDVELYTQVYDEDEEMTVVDKDLRENGIYTIQLANLLTADRAHGDEQLTIQTYSSVSGNETLYGSYTTSMSELIAAAAQLEGLTPVQQAALAALQAMLPAAN